MIHPFLKNKESYKFIVTSLFFHLFCQTLSFFYLFLTFRLLHFYLVRIHEQALRYELLINFAITLASLHVFQRKTGTHIQADGEEQLTDTYIFLSSNTPQRLHVWLLVTFWLQNSAALCCSVPIFNSDFLEKSDRTFSVIQIIAWQLTEKMKFNIACCQRNFNMEHILQLRTGVLLRITSMSFSPAPYSYDYHE